MKNKIKLFHDVAIVPGVPSYEESKKIIAQKWGQDFSDQKPSYLLKVGDKIRMYCQKNKDIIDSEHFVKHNYENGLHMVNAYGLIVAEYLDKIYNFILPGSFIVAIDSEEFLPDRSFTGRVVAVLYKNNEGKYLPIVLPYGMFLEKKEYFLVAQK